MDATSPAVSDRAIRQRDLVPPAALASFQAIVIGVGAVGRQVALQLAALGIPELTLVDDDQVAPENLAVQGYRHADLGRTKVAATAALCRELNPSTPVHEVAERFRRSTPDTLGCLSPVSSSLACQSLAVFSCVDSMAARRLIWDGTRRRRSLFVDGRMAGEVVRTLSANSASDPVRYESTLFADALAHPAPCTGRSTLYAASLLAGMMLSRFAMHLRGLPLPLDTVFNLLAGELTVVE